MKKILLLLFVFKISIATLFSQNIELNLKSFYGVWNNELSGYYYGGGEIEILYEQPLLSGALRTGLAFRSVDWGNQASISIGYKTAFIVRDKWMLNGTTTAGIGMALFYKNPQYIWSLGFMPELTWLRKKRMDFNIGIGFRYTSNPAYKNYGAINQLFEFPLKLGIIYKLKQTS